MVLIEACSFKYTVVSSYCVFGVLFNKMGTEVTLKKNSVRRRNFVKIMLQNNNIIRKVA